MTHKEPRLPSRAEAMLAELPVPEGDWEARARAIDQKVATVAIGSTEAALLQAPVLGVEPGEPASAPDAGIKPEFSRANPPAPSSGASLADLARSVAQKPAREESKALFKKSLSVAAAARAQLPVTARVHSSTLPTLAAPAEEAPARKEEAQRSALGPFLAGAGVAIAAAAVVAFVMRAPAQAPAPVVVTQPAIVNQPPRAPPEPVERAPRPEAPPPSEAPATTPPVAEGSERARAGDEAQRVAKRVEPQPERAPQAAAVARPPATSKTSPKPERVTLEDAPEAPATAPSQESALRPASGASNTIPDHPSNGATQAALGSVLGAARACVAGMSDSSTASIVFNADGRVAKVTVSGPAAGTPAGGCIQSALSRARVSPFTKPTFVVSGIAVRP